MSDPYLTLNVARDADQSAIKHAFRKLAKRLHPDRHPGDARAEQRFKEITQAYRLLADPKQRARFDRGEIDGEGRPRRFTGYGFGAGPFGTNRAPGSDGAESTFGNAFERAARTGGKGGLGGLFGDLFRRARNDRPAAAATTSHGTDRRYRLEVDFLTAVRGGRERLRLDDGRALEIEVPAGAETGRILRLRGQGQVGSSGAPSGDALVELAVRPHPRFTRAGADIHLEQPISLPEAVLGARVEVATIDGPVRLAIAPGANSGQVLRLRGKGAPDGDGGRGDQYVKLMVVLPDPPDPELVELLRRWAEEHVDDVRTETGP